MAVLKKLVNGEYVSIANLGSNGEGSNPSHTPDFSSLNGKYCLAIGDSYTYAIAGDGGALTNLNARIGMAGTLNHGIVSSTLRDRKTETGNGNAFKPIVCRVLNERTEDSSGGTITGDYVPMDRADIGYITLMGGTNDSYGYDSSVGSDPMFSDKTHIYGAMNLTMQKLLESYPNVPIIVILQPPSANLETDATPEGEDCSRNSQYVNSVCKSQRKQKAIREVAEIYANAYPHVHVVDCCFDWFSPINPSDLSTYWKSDMLHLTVAGYQKLVDKVFDKLKEIF